MPELCVDKDWKERIVAHRDIELDKRGVVRAKTEEEKVIKLKEIEDRGGMVSPKVINE